MCVCCKCELCVGMNAVHVCVVFSVSLFQCVMCVMQVQSILKYLFPVPKADSKRIITFANSEDYISFR